LPAVAFPVTLNIPGVLKLPPLNVLDAFKLVAETLPLEVTLPVATSLRVVAAVTLNVAPEKLALPVACRCSEDSVPVIVEFNALTKPAFAYKLVDAKLIVLIVLAFAMLVNMVPAFAYKLPEAVT